MSTAGSKIEDDKQEYQYSIPFVTPSGHEFTFYDTPENERLIVKHSSGSRIEFKADGSVFITAIKDLHTHASILSSEGTEAKPADVSTMRFDTDLDLVVQGRLNIKCASLDLEVGESAKMYAGTDFTIQGNNIIEKATEAITMEGTKAIHVDTKNYSERSVTHVTEEGTKEDGSKGGLSILNVHGNAVIQNDDPTGGITISSKGYLSLVAGTERVDITGMWTPTPEVTAAPYGATFTQMVFPGKGTQDISKSAGDYSFVSTGGAYYQYATAIPDHSLAKGFGLTQNVVLGNMQQNVTGLRNRVVGLAETVTIGGIQRITALQIYLN